MKHAPVHSKSTRQDTATSPHRPITGRDGISIAPPTYGIDFVDRQRNNTAAESGDSEAFVDQQSAHAANAAGYRAAMFQPDHEDSHRSSQHAEAAPFAEELQMKAAPAPAQFRIAHPPGNDTGLPDSLKSGIETLSGISMDNVNVHYNSPQPARLNALAYAQGRDIHVAPGQERHLPHEAWHLIQQAQGRVSPTLQLNGAQVNEDQGLEREAEVMGRQALQRRGLEQHGTGPAVEAVLTGQRQRALMEASQLNGTLQNASMGGGSRGAVIQRVPLPNTTLDTDNPHDHKQIINRIHQAETSDDRTLLSWRRKLSSNASNKNTELFLKMVTRKLTVLKTPEEDTMLTKFEQCFWDPGKTFSPKIINDSTVITDDYITHIKSLDKQGAERWKKVLTPLAEEYEPLKLTWGETIATNGDKTVNQLLSQIAEKLRVDIQEEAVKKRKDTRGQTPHHTGAKAQDTIYETLRDVMTRAEGTTEQDEKVIIQAFQKLEKSKEPVIDLLLRLVKVCSQPGRSENRALEEFEVIGERPIEDLETLGKTALGRAKVNSVEISTFRDNPQDADKVQSVAETIIHEITHYGVFQVYGGERNVYNNPWMPPNMFRSGSTQIKEAYRKQGEMTAKINDLVRATQLTMNDAFLMLQNVGNQEAYAQDQWAREILPHIVQTIYNWEATDKSKAIRDQAEEKVSKGDKGDKGDEKKLAIDKMIIDEMDKMLEVFRTDLERKVTELEHESSA